MRASPEEIQQHLTDQDFEKARRIATDFLNLEPGNAAVRLMLAWACFGLGHLDEARTQTRQARHNPAQMRNALMLEVRCLMATGAHEEALALANTLLDLSEDDLSLRELLYRAALGVGRLELGNQHRAYAQAKAANLRWPWQATLALAEARQDAESALLALADMRHRWPQDPRLDARWAYWQTRSGAWNDEASIRDAIEDLDISPADEREIFAAFSNRTGKPHTALKPLEEAFKAAPDNRKLRTQLAYQYALRHRPDDVLETQFVYLKATHRGGLRAPADAVSAIETDPSRRNPIFSLAAALTWRARDPDTISLPAWQDRAEWGQKANAVLDDAFLYDGTDQSDLKAEIARIVAPLDLDALRATQQAGRGCIIALAHINSVLPVICALDLEFPNILVIGNGMRVRAQVRKRADLGTISLLEKPLAGVRKVMRHLEDGGLVIAAPDYYPGQPVPRKLETVPFGHGSIQIRSLPAELALKTGAISLFGGVHWVDKRQHLSLTELPETKPSESLKAYQTRWCAAYAEQLEKLVLDQPEATSVQLPWACFLNTGTDNVAWSRSLPPCLPILFPG